MTPNEKLVALRKATLPVAAFCCAFAMSASAARGTSTNVGIGDPYVPGDGNLGYDVKHYDLNLTWEPVARRLAGTATISAVAKEHRSDFSVDLQALSVESVTVRGRPASFRQADNKVIVRPKAALSKGAAFETVIVYAGVPKVDKFGMGWRTVGDTSYAIGEPSGASTWLPVNQHPSDKATYRFAITAPTGLTAVANGILKTKTARGSATTWVYEPRDPIASYLLTIAIGKLDVVSGGTVGTTVIRHVVLSSQRARVLPILASQPQMLRYFTRIFGPYPFEAAGAMFVPDSPGGALETQTLSTFDESFASGTGPDIVLSHELAHQWFGDSVTVRSWRDVWLNEGFATYAADLWMAHRDPKVNLDTTYAKGLACGRDSIRTAVTPPPVGHLFNTSVYLRGAATLHALRLTVGDKTFFSILKAWAREHRYGNATTADFVALASKMAARNLRPFLEKWLTAKEAPATFPGVAAPARPSCTGPQFP